LMFAMLAVFLVSKRRKKKKGGLVYHNGNHICSVHHHTIHVLVHLFETMHAKLFANAGLHCMQMATITWRQVSWWAPPTRRTHSRRAHRRARKLVGEGTTSLVAWSRRVPSRPSATRS
jgi:hypothetical protein